MKLLSGMKGDLDSFLFGSLSKILVKSLKAPEDERETSLPHIKYVPHPVSLADLLILDCSLIKETHPIADNLIYSLQSYLE